MIRVYIAGPLHGSGLELDNVRKAIEWADRVWSEGMYPFVPHFFSFWNLITPHYAAEWLELDLEWLEQCHALLRLPGVSPGTEIEVARMRDLGRPVFTTEQFEDLVQWGKKEQTRLSDLNIMPVPEPYFHEMIPSPRVTGQMLPSVCTFSKEYWPEDTD